MAKFLKSKLFLISILPTLLIVVWLFLSLELTGETVSRTYNADSVAKNNGIMDQWADLRNLSLLIYLLALVIWVIRSFITKKRDRIIKDVLVFVLGIFLISFSLLIGLIIWDFYKIIA